MRRRGSLSGWLLGPLVVVVGAMFAGPGANADPVAGSQGIDTSLLATDSLVTVKGRGAFSNVAITINQTANLTNQAVSITWTGAAPTVTSPGTFSSNYFQIMQCWGDDDGKVPSNPGPPPEQCVFGAIGSTTAPPASIYPDPYAVSRIIGVVGWPNLDRTDGFVDTRSGFVWRPFRSVDGTAIDVQTDPTFLQGTQGGNSWLNPYSNSVTTNEIAAARTTASGKGAELLEVHTGLESSGLGCGQKVQPTADGAKVPQCWIVIVPRGSSTVENAGTPFADAGPAAPVGTSPMRSQAWQNRIAVPISFIPVETACSLNRTERRLSGSDLILPAVASWQPVLCGDASLPPYSYVPVGDATARQQLASAVAGGPGMVVVSRPLDSTAIDPLSPAVYSPVGVSGVVIGFNIERNPRSGDPAASDLAGVRVAELNLTPRLVAKLLSQSYQQQIRIGGALPASAQWAKPNPVSMATDPDFLQFNPEFPTLISNDDRTFSGLQLPSGTSDAAQQLWEWVLADPEAKAWLDGQTDEWGMNINPVYSTDAQLNPTGVAFGSPIPQTFPKADPYCFQGAPRGLNGSIVPPPLCGTDWMPYSRNFNETAKVARTGFDGARIVENPLALSSSQVWSRVSPQSNGKRMMLSVTDTPSAAQFGVQMARLSRAGDNGSDRQFVAPDQTGLLTGVQAMTPGSEPTVLQGRPSTAAPGAYPLTMVSYAAIKPLSLDATARAEYATFIDYAAGPGQVIGTQVGQLPRGYAPLPADLVSQAAVAANAVRTMTPAPPPTAPVTTAPPDTAPPDAPATVTQSPPSSGRRPSSTTPPPPASTVPDAVTTTIPELATTATDVTTTATEVTTTTVAPASAVTASTPPSRARFAVVGLGIAAMGSAIGALEISKRPRRASLNPDHLELEPEPSL